MEIAMEKAVNGSTRSVLTLQQSYHLANWVAATQEECKTLTHQEAAEKAAKALGMPVTTSNMATARHVTGVQWKAPRGQVATGRKGKYDDRVYRVASSLLNLYKMLGVQPDEHLLRVCGRKINGNGEAGQQTIPTPERRWTNTN